MTGRNVNIYFQEETYSKIKSLIKQRKVSEFVNQAVEKELEKRQKKEKAELKEKLISAYKRMAKNKKLQKELAILEEVTTKVVVPITTEDINSIEPFEVFIDNTPKTGLEFPSKIQFNYPFTVDKERLKEHLGIANQEIMEQAKISWKIAFDTEE
nr:13418_t:CDS:2 [Entrophospora candida]